MTDKLPHHLLQLFAPRPPLRYLQLPDHAPEQRRTPRISGVAAFLDQKKEYEKIPYMPSPESWFEKKIRDKAEKRERAAELERDPHKEWQPDKDPNVRGDTYKTLFVGRLSYDVKTEDLEREFGKFGPIERIRIVKDETKKEDADDEEDQKPLKGKQKRKMKRPHRGYAFVVFEREKDMKEAFKSMDGRSIKDRKIVVDVERGRTVADWRPRRLGGGKGGRDYTKTAPARPGFYAGGPPSGPGGFRGGGFRGGFGDRGGFGGRGGGRFGDRGPGGFSGPPRGAGIGYQDSGRGGSGGRPPPNAPAGPGMGRPGGGYGGSGGGGATNGDDRGYRGGGGGSSRYGDRGMTGSNREPIRPRDGGGYNDPDKPRDDRDRGYAGGRRDDYPRKRYQESGHYDDDSRQRRRY